MRVSARTPAAQSAPIPPPTPDIGVASAPEQVPSVAYPPGVQVPVIVNNFISVVSDEADLAQQRRDFLARQREERQGVPAPKHAQPGSAPAASQSQQSVSSGPEGEQTRAVKNWALLSQAGFFRIVQRWRCRELQKRWEACMKLKNHLQNHQWEKTRSLPWAVAEGFKGSQPKKRLSAKPARAEGGLGAESSDEDPVQLIR